MNQFGNRWVQTHEFQIGSYCYYFILEPKPDIQSELGRLRSLSINCIDWATPAESALAKTVGLGAHRVLWVSEPFVTGGTISPELLARIKTFSTPDLSAAWYVDDEPKENDFHAIAVVSDYLKTNTPDDLIYSNISFEDANPTFLNTYLNAVKPDILKADTYPFFKPGKPAWYPENPDWFKIAMNIRNCALANDIPYFTWLEAFGSQPTAPHFFRFPSESEMRTEAYTALTLGFKGISWFGYDAADPSTCNFLVEWSTREPEKTYYWVKSIDREVKNLGVYLRFLKSTDVRFVPNKGNPTPAGLTNWSESAGGDKYIESIELSKPAHTRQDALLGFFTDEQARQYFMLQNLYRGEHLSASAATSTITVKFKGTSLPVRGTIYRLDRKTCKSVAVPLVNGNELRDRLPGGTADLYSYTPFALGIL